MFGIRAIVLAGMFAIMLAAGARADEAGPGYHALRYNDDFSYLSDPAKASDWWDPVKYLSLGSGPYGPSYLSLGGELRERAESYLNPNFGIKAPRANAYLLHRLLLNADLHLTDYLRLFVQLGEMERLGNRGVTSTTDIDRFEPMQAFVDLKPPAFFGDAPVFRAGREELLFGDQRLIAVREGPNVRRDFDGFRFSDRIGGATIDLLLVRPLNDNIDVFDDRTNYNQLLWGAYATVPVGQAMKADLYWLGYQNKLAKYRGLTGVENRQTYGTRLYGAAGGLDWEAEAAVQTGSFRGSQIRAAMGAGVLGYTFQQTVLKPRIAVEANAASGDNSRDSAIGTFNAMFPRLPYFAVTSLLVPANVIDVRPVMNLHPNEDVVVTLGWDTLWRASVTDGLYGSGMVQYTGTAKGSGDRVGTELSATVRWRVDPHLTLGAQAAEFLAGPAVQQALGKNVTFFVLYGTYKF